MVPLLSKDLNTKKLLRITTAGKGVEDTAYLPKGKQTLEVLGYQIVDYDIEGQDEQEIKEKLLGFDVLLMTGGNTFYLLKAIHDSGFQKAVEEFLDRGGIYVGGSAGAYVCCPTIKMAEWSRPEWNFMNLTELTGMNLVLFCVKVHVTEELLPFLRGKAKELNYPLRLLTDDQFLMVQGDRVTFYGQGEELRV